LVLQERIPIWMSRGTYVAIGQPDLGDCLHLIGDGGSQVIGDLEILPFTVAHDAKEPLQLVATDGAKRFGLLTDVGHITAHVTAAMQHLDALVLECNHDAERLNQSSYPPFLKQRIAGDYGHLSNAQSADFLRTVMHPALQHVVAAHLSEQNNSPELVQMALASVLNCQSYEVLTADALNGFDWLEA
jgi:phosphoribosyl 1,2-cyclic phosphodiesterase